MSMTFFRFSHKYVDYITSGSGPYIVQEYALFDWVRGAQFLVFYLVFYRPLSAFFIRFFVWLMYCMTFELRLLMTPLVSSNVSLFHQIIRQRV